MYESQANSPSAAVSAIAAFGLIIAAEDVLLFILDDADARICHLHLEEEVGRVSHLGDFCADGDGAAVACELDGVRHEIIEDMLDIRR